ncbi:MAG: MFS transporter [Burkholderiales bacterium]|nr:MFS transporter [Burkholderiales bacterium]
MSSSSAAPEATFRAEATTISVVSLAHGTSHFFQLVLPPLFPWLATEFSLSFAQLGALASLFYLVSAFGQAAAGFVVDRFGARVVMFGGLTLFAVAALTAAMADGYALLVVAAVLLGIGNSPFHPVDFSIINQRISSARIGHAYSAHGLSGTLGYASATFVMVMLAQGFGWRAALGVAAFFALVVLAVAVTFRDVIDTRHLLQRAAAPAHAENATQTGTATSRFEFLRLPVVWLCFAFFFVITFSNSAIQNFSTPALQAIAGLKLTVAATALTGYLVCSAIGQLAGGFAISRQWADPERIIAVALSGSASLLALAATGATGPTITLLLVMLAGLGTGVAGPSRDLLIKRATPSGATGRVYGTVYSGLDAGLAVSAPIFGWLMDHDLPRSIFFGAAIAMLVAMLVGLAIGRVTRVRHH